jgi:hypothetical protein
VRQGFAKWRKARANVALPSRKTHDAFSAVVIFNFVSIGTLCDTVIKARQAKRMQDDFRDEEKAEETQNKVPQRGENTQLVRSTSRRAAICD